MQCGSHICSVIHAYMELMLYIELVLYINNCYTHLSLSLYIFKQFAYIYYCNYIMVM